MKLLNVTRILDRVSNISCKQKEDIILLFKEHNLGKINIISYLNLFVEQIELNLENIYERFYKLKNEITPRSSSLNACIVKYGEEEGKRKYEIATNKRKHNLENYIVKYGESEGPIKYKEYVLLKTHSLQSYILRHGEEEGPIKYKEYWKDNNFSNSLPAAIRRHGKDGHRIYKEINTRGGFHRTLEGQIVKYGEEGKRRYNEINKRKSKNQSKETLISKMLKDDFTIEEIIEQIEYRWSRSLKTFIKKYGKEEGEKRYKEFICALRKKNRLLPEYYMNLGFTSGEADEAALNFNIEMNSKINNPSKESLNCLLPMMKSVEIKTNIKCSYGLNELIIKLSEKEREISKRKFFMYDFSFEELKLIIEYHGVYYHDDVEYNSTPNLNENYFVENYNFDLFKKWVAEQRGYTVFVIRSWNKNEDMLTLLKYLKERDYI